MAQMTNLERAVRGLLAELDTNPTVWPKWFAERLSAILETSGAAGGEAELDQAALESIGQGLFEAYMKQQIPTINWTTDTENVIVLRTMFQRGFEAHSKWITRLPSPPDPQVKL